MTKFRLILTALAGLAAAATVPAMAHETRTASSSTAQSDSENRGSSDASNRGRGDHTAEAGHHQRGRDPLQDRGQHRRDRSSHETSTSR